MSSPSVFPSSAQNQQHPFLFQAQHPHYSSGDDGDSPPSLTNSSESPRSTSEEGESSSTLFDSFDQAHTKESMTPQNASVNEGSIKGDDMIMSPIQAFTPNWESVFASSLETDEMDMNTSMPDVEWKPIAETATTTSSVGNAPTALKNAEQGDSWSSNNFPSAFQSWPSSSADSNINDEAMFNSLIQEDSFEQSNQPAIDEQTPGTSGHLSIDTTPSSLPTPSQPTSMTSASNHTPPQSALPTTSALSSRRNSVEHEARYKTINVPPCGSHYSHTSDSDLPSSSSVVVRPPRSELRGLQVHVHGINYTGAKSRVETQIRTRIELVRPVNESKESLGAFERIGTFTHVKLPPLTGTKRKSKKPKPTDIAPEKTLFMDATVVRATAPHDRVFVCASCQQRERKRAQRKRISTIKKEEKPEDNAYSHEDLVEYGINPEAPDAQEQAKHRATQEDERRVVVFNCGDFIDFEEGACVLPTRITCYCRHHKEKTGFCLIFTMRDYQGTLIATGSTPPIMITDDHKSVAAAQAQAAATAPSTSSKISEGARSRGVSIEALDESTLRSINREAAKKKRLHRARPYGDADDRASRRNTLSSNTTMTPFASTGQNTPAAGQSPPSLSDMNQPEFWHAFASMSTMTSSPPASMQTSVGIQTPHESLSPTQQRSPVQQPTSINSNDWLANFANQGSLSSQTLQLSPQSLPGFDLNAFTNSLQQSSQQAGDDATMQQLLMLARSLPGVGHNPQHNIDSQTGSSMPVPTISKLIPGDGPTCGGIEVTVLGENFVNNMTCVFGDVPAISTTVWGSNTLLCILPPSASPGPVAVSIKSPNGEVYSRNEQDGSGRSLQLFTYIDSTDRSLMELALQVVGLQMTGQMQTARDVAMRVVGSGSNLSMTTPSETSPQQHGGTQQMRSAVPGLFASGSGNQSFQNSVLSFLTTLDVSVGVQRMDAIRLANKEGHTLLHLAVILGFHRLALDLIHRGCPINARDHNGYTALHFAALHGRMTIARLLLGKGARVDVECEAGKYPIDVAREREQVDVELLFEEFMSSEDESDQESDWTTDEEEEEVDFNTHVDGKVVGGIAKEDNEPLEEASSLSSLDEKANLKAREESQESDKKSFEAMFGLKGLVSGGMDLAQKWPNVAIGKIGMPLALHDRLQSMQMPTVSVFQMVMPPNFMSRNAGTGGADASAAGDKGKTREQNVEESSRTMTMWRNIFEESALWINPLYSPPPTYESSVLPAKSDTFRKSSSSSSSKEKGIPMSRGNSRFPAIAQASPDSPHKDHEMRRRMASHTDMGSRSVSWHPDHQLPLSTIVAPPAKSHSSSSLPTRSRTIATNTTSKSAMTSPRRFKEDPMLVYFWLPSLVFVVFLLCFTSPSSVLSFKDLVSFMPV